MVRVILPVLQDFIDDERGSPLVEFSVMAPLFLMVMFGIVEWGNIFYVQNNMLIAARQAARNWAVDGPPSSASTTATSTITSACNAVPLYGSNFSYTFTLTYYSGCTGPGTPAGTYGIATMTITTPAAPASLVNYLGSVTGLTLSASATLQEEFVCPAAGPVTKTVSNQTC
ncbi:MAG: pilus assembly protein [Hyphomicrobiales bacterium]|nr:pilus assembly protein [Hyphomicrobiales bacterium]